MFGGSVVVGRKCTILGHIKDVDRDMFELIQDLCMGSKLRPRNKNGITFLRPTGDLKKEIERLAMSDDPSKATEIIDSLILYQYYPTLEDLQNNAKSLVTCANTILPVDDLKGGVLTVGDAKVKGDEFKAVKERPNMMVYQISGKLDLKKFGKATIIDKENKPKIRGKTGGGDTTGSRLDLVKRILKLHSTTHDDCAKRKGLNPAMEVLLSLASYLKGDERENVISQLSYDTLASLVIVLQPCSTPTYISEQSYSEWSSKFNYTANGLGNLYCFTPDPVESYVKLMEEATANNKSLVSKVASKQSELLDDVSKPTIVDALLKFYEELESDLKKNRDKLQLLAEAELRVFSAVLHDNGTDFTYEQLEKLYVNDCKLDRPYICHKRELVNKAPISFYYSVAYLIVRSDALLYLPGLNDGKNGLDAIQTEGSQLKLFKDFAYPTDKSVYSTLYTSVSSFFDAWQAQAK